MAVPEPVTLLGVMLPQVSPDGTVSVKLTVPPNWFTELTVTVAISEPPALAGPGGLADIVKSRYWKMATAVWIKDTLVPVRDSV